MNAPKELCIISFKPLSFDPRIYRQAQWLKNHYQVYTLGPADTAIPGIPCVDMGYRPSQLSKHLQRGLFLLLQQHLAFYWNAPHVQHSWRRLQQLRPDILVANELECWPLAVRAKKEWGCKILLDAHEFYPGMYNESLKWRLAFGKFTDYMCHTTLPYADQITTVSKSIQEFYQERFGYCPEIITNAPFYQDLPIKKNTSSKIRLIHHGHPLPNRHPDLLIDAMQYTDPHFELTFMFKVTSANESYFHSLRKKAESNPRIQFVDAVPMTEIPKTINHYDVGVHVLPPINLNHEGALPNKFFEFIQARLAIVFSPTKEVKRIITDHDLGLVSPDFSAQAMGETLNQLTHEKIIHYKQQANKVSKTFCAETNGKLFLQLVQAMENMNAQ